MSALGVPVSACCPSCDYEVWSNGWAVPLCPECGRAICGGDGASPDPATLIDAAHRRLFLRSSALLGPLHAATALAAACLAAWSVRATEFLVSGAGMLLLSGVLGSLACLALPRPQRLAARCLWMRTAFWTHTPWLTAVPLLRLAEWLQGPGGLGVIGAGAATLLLWAFVIAGAYYLWRWSWVVGVTDRSTAHGAGLPRAAAECRAFRLAAGWTAGASAALGFFWFAMPMVILFEWRG